MKRRVPTRYPMKLEQQYARDLKKVVTDWDRGARSCAKFYLKQYVNGGTQLKLDDATGDPNWIDKLNQQIELMGFSMQQASKRHDVNSIATKFVRALNSFSYQNVKAQAAIVGLDPISDNNVLRNYVKGKIRENVSSTACIQHIGIHLRKTFTVPLLQVAVLQVSLMQLPSELEWAKSMLI